MGGVGGVLTGGRGAGFFLVLGMGWGAEGRAVAAWELLLLILCLSS